MNDREERLPIISPDVVAWLLKLFPNACPDVEDSLREIWMAVGAQIVVRKLRVTMEHQTNNALDRDLLDSDNDSDND